MGAGSVLSPDPEHTQRYHWWPAVDHTAVVSWTELGQTGKHSQLEGNLCLDVLF